MAFFLCWVGVNDDNFCLHYCAVLGLGKTTLAGFLAGDPAHDHLAAGDFQLRVARVKPSVYAAATLLRAAVSPGISGVSAATLRRQRRLAREIKAALPTLAQQIFPGPVPAR